MAEVTEAQKAEMLEKARAKKQAEVNQAAKPVPEPEKVMPEVPVNAPTFNPRTQGVQEWGPYDDYVIVTTNYGQFGVPKGSVMHFEPEKVFDRREGVWRVVHTPRYREANAEEKEYAAQAAQRQRALEENVLSAQSWPGEVGEVEGNIGAPAFS